MGYSGNAEAIDEIALFQHHCLIGSFPSPQDNSCLLDEIFATLQK